LNKLQSSAILHKIDDDTVVRGKFIHRIDSKIDLLNRKDFLAKVEFPSDSKTNQKFLKYSEILNKLKSIAEKGSY
jgi:hypothetical protein